MNFKQFRYLNAPLKFVISGICFLFLLQCCGVQIQTRLLLAVHKTRLHEKWQIVVVWHLTIQCYDAANHTSGCLYHLIWATAWQNQQNESAPSEHSDWSESSLCAQWVDKDPRFLHANSNDSDQTGRIWVFAGRTLTLLVLSCRGSILVYGLFKTHP